MKSFKLIEISQILLLIIITTGPACNYETFIDIVSFILYFCVSFIEAFTTSKSNVQ